MLSGLMQGNGFNFANLFAQRPTQQPQQTAQQTQ